MKTSVSTYSFMPLFREGKIDLSGIIKAAKEIGFDGVEFANNTAFTGDPITHATQLRKECAEAGLAVVNYTVGADLLNGTEGNSPENEIDRIKKQIDIAEALGAPGLRHDATWGPGKDLPHWHNFDTLLPRLADGCRALTEYAATKNIKTMVENHGYFAQDSDRMEKLTAAVAHENFGILCDIGNFLCADETPALAVARIARQTVHAHAKDFHIKPASAPHPGDGFFPTRAGSHLRGAIIGHGEVPVAQCLRILKKAGYNGYVSIEFEGIEDPILALTIGLKNLRNYINAL